MRPKGYPGDRLFSISEFLSTSGVCRGVFFSRQEVIQYIANVRGGVHIGKKDRKKEEVLVAKLRPIERTVRIERADGLLVELVAIGQALGGSDDAARFCAAVAQLKR